MNASTPIIVAVISGLLGQPIIQLISSHSRRRLKKIRNADEALNLFKKLDDNFNKKFILPELKETYFYIQTGIKTNEKSIEKYIEFKNHLGENYTWSQIKTAKPHLRIEKLGITVSLSKYQRVFSNIVLILALFFFILGMIGFIYLNQFESTNLEDFFVTIFVLIVPMFTGYFFVNGINSILVAKGIERRLNLLDNN